MSDADYYETHAEAFVAATIGADMSSLRHRFLSALPPTQTGPVRILDAGAGSGRDARAFREAGFAVSAFDASAAMVAATRAHAGVPARQLRFEDFVWEHPFEGIWACASLLHVARDDLMPVIARLARHLVPKGMLYLSFKSGTQMRIKDGRRFTDMTTDDLAQLLNDCGGLAPPDIWETRDCRPERGAETWVNALVSRR